MRRGPVTKNLHLAPVTTPTQPHLLVSNRTNMSTINFHPSVSLTTTIKHLACNFRNPRILTNLTKTPAHLTPRFRKFTVSMATTPFEVCVKASYTVPNKLGDCKFKFLPTVICFINHKMCYIECCIITIEPR